MCIGPQSHATSRALVKAVKHGELSRVNSNDVSF
jgi:hypothetical protein